MYTMANAWGEMVQHLLVDSRNYSVLLVHYENLKSSLVPEMMQMLKFLDYSITETTLKERLEEDFTAFHRHQKSTFEHYTSDQKKYVNSIIDRHSNIETGLPLGLRQYIRPT